MPKISAIIHTHNDALRLGRALESLRPFDGVLIIDHGSTDGTAKAAREHGAWVRKAALGADPSSYIAAAQHDWVFCLLPTESLGEGLEASLFEWKELTPGPLASYSVAIRMEVDNGWQRLSPETRLVHRQRLSGGSPLPPNDCNSILLEGDLLRFSKP